MSTHNGSHCPGCGLPNYTGLCPVCRGDEQAYLDELHSYFGDFYEGQTSNNSVVVVLESDDLPF